jgi:hypothetical protein
MITILTFNISHYFTIPVENYTEKLISAIGLANLIEDFDEKDLKRLKFIEQNTHEKVLVSIYKLDRVVNPTKGEVKETEYSFKFKRNKFSTDEDKYVKMNDLTIQKYLCEAIREVHQIVMKNLRGYMMEHKIQVNKTDNKEMNKLMELIS